MKLSWQNTCKFGDRGVQQQSTKRFQSQCMHISPVCALYIELNCDTILMKKSSMRHSHLLKRYTFPKTPEFLSFSKTRVCRF